MLVAHPRLNVTTKAVRSLGLENHTIVALG